MKIKIKNLYVLVGAVLAVAALSAVAVSSASAAIEVLWCMPSVGGLYTTKQKCENLEEKGATETGAWEWEGPLLAEAGISLVDFSSGKGRFVAVGSHTIECQADEGSGEPTGANTIAKISVKFTQCTEGTSECHSLKPAGGANEILLNALDGELVYLKAAKGTPVGLLLLPESGTEFTEIECGGTNIGSVSGEVIAELFEGLDLAEKPTASPVNTELLEVHILFEPNAAKNEQLWQLIEEAGSAHKLTAFFGLVQVYEESEELIQLLTLNEAGNALEMTDFEIMA